MHLLSILPRRVLYNVGVGRSHRHYSPPTLQVLPPGSLPEHLTMKKCAQMHSLFCEGINQTEEIEEILTARIRALKHKRAQSDGGGNDSVGWIQSSAGGVDSRSSYAGKDTNKQQEQQQQKKKDRARTKSGSGQGPQNKRIKRNDDKSSSANHLPAWVTRIPKAGDQIAVKENDEAVWILATVVKHNKKKGTVLVVEGDAGVGSQKKFYVKRSHILALQRPEEASGAIFPVGTEVMTLYPQTTVFYPATISAPFVEGENGERDSCVVQFQDDEFTTGGKLLSHTVDARYVRYRDES